MLDADPNETAPASVDTGFDATSVSGHGRACWRPDPVAIGRVEMWRGGVR
jgi:hypothetical protein